MDIGGMADLLGKLLDKPSEYVPRKGCKREKLLKMLQEGGYTAEEMMKECGMSKNYFNLALQRFREKHWQIERKVYYRIRRDDGKEV